MADASKSSEPIPCIHCKYDLRGTSLLANCPECGKPVEHTKLGYRVEGEYLVMRYGAREPQRCALTNQRVLTKKQIKAGIVDPAASRGAVVRVILGCTESMRQVQIAGFGLMTIVYVVAACAPLWRGKIHDMVMVGCFLAGLVIGAGLMLWGFRDLKHRFGGLFIQKTLMNRQVWMLWRHLILICVGFMYCAFIMVAWLDEFAVLPNVWGVCPAISFVIVMTITRPLFAVHQTSNGENWIAGCCPEYLAFCKSERQRLLDEAHAAAQSEANTTANKEADASAAR